MASGEISQAGPAVINPNGVFNSEGLPLGSEVTPSGRVSTALFPGQGFANPPFTREELISLDDALRETSNVAEVRFSVYLGDLGADAVAGARDVLAKAPEPANGALIAVSPNTREVVVVSGARVAGRVNDRVAELGVTAALSSFRQNELINGLISALRVMATAVARP
ncbi:MAG: DUF5130 family protein [Gordonia sp. (in: high G+C Gram-positive bacteria)]